MVTVVFMDESWLEGKLYWRWGFEDIKGTYHLRVAGACDSLSGLLGKKVAVSVANVKYFIVG